MSRPISTNPAKRKIFFVELDNQAILREVHGKLLHLLRRQFDVVEVTSLALLVSLSRDTTVLVSSFMTTIRERTLNERLIKYVRSGGTVIFCDPFSSMINTAKMNKYWRFTWGVPWQAGAYRSLDLLLNCNGHAKVADYLGVLKEYSVGTLYLKNVATGAAMYSSSLRPPRDPSQTPVIFQENGQGFMGYVGSANGDTASNMAILAMCGLASNKTRRLQAVNTKPKESKHCETCNNAQRNDGRALMTCAQCRAARYCPRECQKADWRTHKRMCAQIQGRHKKDGPSQSEPSTATFEESRKPAAELRPVKVPKPFHALENKTYLYARSNEDVLRILFEAYRMRVKDEYKFTGEVKTDSLYSGKGSLPALRGFTKFVMSFNKHPWFGGIRMRAPLA